MRATRTVSVGGYIRWSQEMKDQLREYWQAGMPVKEIAALLTNGSEDRVYGKAWNLGLGHHPNPVKAGRFTYVKHWPPKPRDSNVTMLKANWDHKPRRCLCCSESFLSEGAHERVCQRCKGTENWRSGIREYGV